jgi:hypothetical protein
MKDFSSDSNNSRGKGKGGAGGEGREGGEGKRCKGYHLTPMDFGYIQYSHCNLGHGIVVVGLLAHLYKK